MTTGTFVAAAIFLMLCFSLGVIAALMGVYLGGWFVYRTKREPYEALHGSPATDDRPIHIDEFDDLTGEALAQRFEGSVGSFLNSDPPDTDHSDIMDKARERFEASILNDLGPTPDMPAATPETVASTPERAKNG